MDILNGIATESAGVLTVGTSGPPADGIFRDVTLITEGWGSSGYYDGEMLHRDGPKALTPGLRVFSDHAEGPVESSKNVMGVLVSEARPFTDENGKRGLRGDLRVFKTGPYNHEWAYERAAAKAIELSIRSGVQYGSGTREGRYGKIVTAMTEGYSVDVVARGGRGGNFGTIQESKPIGEDTNENEEGSDMPLTKEEQTAIAQETATAISAALAPALAGITTALTGLAQENQKVDAVALVPSAIRGKIAGAKLSDKSTDRVYVAIESAEVATEAVVDAAIAAETARVEEIAAEAKALAADGKGGTLHEKTNEEVAAEAYQPGSIGAWKVATA